jgi:hypothetical protein
VARIELLAQYVVKIGTSGRRGDIQSRRKSIQQKEKGPDFNFAT